MVHVSGMLFLLLNCCFVCCLNVVEMLLYFLFEYFCSGCWNVVCLLLWNAVGALILLLSCYCIYCWNVVGLLGCVVIETPTISDKTVGTNRMFKQMKGIPSKTESLYCHSQIARQVRKENQPVVCALSEIVKWPRILSLCFSIWINILCQGQVEVHNKALVLFVQLEISRNFENVPNMCHHSCWAVTYW